MYGKRIIAFWDSEFLGYAVGRIDAGKGAEKQLPELLARARDARYRLLYLIGASH